MRLEGYEIAVILWGDPCPYCHVLMTPKLAACQFMGNSPINLCHLVEHPRYFFCKTEEDSSHVSASSRHFLPEIPVQTRHFSGTMPRYGKKQKISMLVSVIASCHLTGVFPINLSARVTF